MRRIKKMWRISVVAAGIIVVVVVCAILFAVAVVHMEECQRALEGE